MSPVAIEAVFERVPQGPSADSPAAVRFGLRARLETRPEPAARPTRRGPREAVEPVPGTGDRNAALGTVLAYTALAAVRLLLPPSAHPGALGLHLDARA